MTLEDLYTIMYYASLQNISKVWSMRELLTQVIDAYCIDRLTIDKKLIDFFSKVLVDKVPYGSLILGKNSSNHKIKLP